MRFALFFALLLFPLAFAACNDDDDTGGDTSQASFSRAEQVLEAGKSYTATLETSAGSIVIELFAEAAPNTVNSFVFLAQQGFFDGITFHRVVRGFVIQSGDPTGTGKGDPGFETADEPNEIPNTRGTLAMAKAAGAGGFGSQFFINLKDNHDLDYDNTTNDRFYPFGEVVSGMDVADAIGNSPVDDDDRPEPPIVITRVTIASR